MLLTALLVHVQKQRITGQTLKDVFKLEPALSMAHGNNYWGVDLSNMVASESSNRLSSSHWSIRYAFDQCLLIRYSSNYKAYLHGSLLCLKQYYQFCIRGNAVAQAQELTSQHAPECMRFRFAETTFCQNAKIWDIHVPMGFNINLTVTDLQMTYHPVECYDSQARDGRYTGQGLAIDNYTTVCQRTKHHSYLLPMSKARIILNYTRIPDRPVLEFLYQAITKQEPVTSYLTKVKLTFLNVFCFDLFQNNKTIRLIIYVQPHVRFACSLVNVILRCENNFNRGNKLTFIDGPVFLVHTYLHTHALIARLDCEYLASNVTNSSLGDNNTQYRYLHQVTSSIGDITAVLEGPGIDISILDFSFRFHIPDTHYGNFNVIDYTRVELNTSESLIAKLNLPVQGRHFHVLCWLQKANSSIPHKPRLVFRVKEFDMVSFRDGCHTGGIFIAEGLTIIATYCSQAGITFLNSTSETGGILFGVSPLVLILKGYSWFANIKLTISILYDTCLGVTNICDKFRDNWIMFNKECLGFDDVLCRYVTPTPCIEIVRLPSDGLLDYSSACTLLSHINRSPAVGYIPFPSTLHLTFAIKGHLELQDEFPAIYPEFLEHHFYFHFLAPRDHTRLQLNKYYSLQSESVIVNIKNTYPWLGIGHWIRLIQRLGCPKEVVSLQPLEPLYILRGCPELGMTSVTGHAKIFIHSSVFSRFLHFLNLYQCLNVEIFLLGAEDVSNGRAEGFFNAKLQSLVGGVQKHIVYTKRQYLEIKMFSQHPSQEFSIELEWITSLDRLQFVYIRRPEKIADKGGPVWKDPINESWIGVTEQEVCSRETLSCYRYHQSHDIMSEPTWDMAQAQCAEQNSNLISINSPEEWRLLLQWAYDSNLTNSNSWGWIGAIGPFNGQLLFIGQRRMDASNSVGFLLLDVHKDCAKFTMGIQTAW